MVTYEQYQDESQLPRIMELVGRDLSEPYTIFTYRYFIHNWPELCYLAVHDETVIGCIVCRRSERKGLQRGYIAMLAVDSSFRKRGIGSSLVRHAIDAMQTQCQEMEYCCFEFPQVMLEVEMSNVAAMRLYRKLGFIRDKRLPRYYLHGSDAFRMKLRFPSEAVHREEPDA